MAVSEIYKRIEALCNENGTKITTLLVEITGSNGNAVTWKKGHVRSDFLVAICLKFDVSADYLLGITNTKNQILEFSRQAISFAERFDALDEDGRTVVSSAIIQEERRLEKYQSL